MSYTHDLRPLLARYAISEEHLVGQGMEAHVYAFDAQRVLKVYHRPTAYDHLLALQAWYRRLDTKDVPFHTPFIHTVAQEQGLVYTIEQRLSGSGFDVALPHLVTTHLHQALVTYFDALDAIAQIHVTGTLTRYKLIDDTGISERDMGDWNSFLQRYIQQRLEHLADHFRIDVVHFPEKANRLLSILSQPYHGTLALIHGDFCPGNVVVDGQTQITGVLDFGLFTMVGDHLFDIATGCAFFDMYDRLTQNTRHHLYDLAIQRYGEEVRGMIYRYLLVYSMLSANIYASDCSDGHYAWCVANLNNDDYWKHIS